MKALFRVAACLAVLGGCAGKTPPAESAENADESASSSAGEDRSDPADNHKPSASRATIKDEDKAGPAKCGGFDIDDLAAVLSQASCEVPNANPDAAQKDTKDLLDISVKPESSVVAPGSKTKVRVVFHNKSKADLPLDFVVDPEPEFRFEVYTPKGTRVDAPKGDAPALPDANGPEPEKKVARVTLAPQGTASLTLTWDAVKYKWASKDKAKGALPGHGYPREAAGPLPKGKYVLRVVTPLVGVFEGVDHEVSQPRTPIEVGGS